MDIALLASTVVSTLLMPFAKSIAEGGAREIGKNVANAATTHLAEGWTAVKQAFHTQKEEAALDLFGENPDDMAPVVQRILEDKLRSDPSLTEFLARLVAQGNDTGAHVTGAETAGIVDLRYGNVGGTNNQITGVRIEKSSVK